MSRTIGRSGPTVRLASVYVSSVNFLQTLVIAGVPTLGAVVAASVALRDLGLRRRLETSRQFLSLFANANGRPTDGRDEVGVPEQVATVHLIADFARREADLYYAAHAGLKQLVGWGAHPSGAPVAEAAKSALDRLGAPRTGPRGWLRDFARR